MLRQRVSIVLVLVLSVLLLGCERDVLPDLSKAIFITTIATDSKGEVTINSTLNPDNTGSLVITRTSEGYTGSWKLESEGEYMKISTEFHRNNGGMDSYQRGPITLYKNGKAQVLLDNGQYTSDGTWKQ